MLLVTPALSPPWDRKDKMFSSENYTMHAWTQHAAAAHTNPNKAPYREKHAFLNWTGMRPQHSESSAPHSIQISDNNVKRNSSSNIMTGAASSNGSSSLAVHKGCESAPITWLMPSREKTKTICSPPSALTLITYSQFVPERTRTFCPEAKPDETQYSYLQNNLSTPPPS